MNGLFEFGRRCAVAGRVGVNSDQALARAERSDDAATTESADCPLLSEDPRVQGGGEISFAAALELRKRLPFFVC
jgi:hypothetical protein